MKVKETFISFTRKGDYSFFINLDKYGSYIPINDLVEQSLHFCRIVLLGDEVFKQKEDVKKFINKCSKKNTDIIFEIFTKGIERPVGVGNINSVIFNVELQLKNSNINYKKRIFPTVIDWFNTINANFIFNVFNIDDIDEADMLVKDFGISKSKVILCPNDTDKLKETLIIAKRYGYNCLPNFRKILWNNIGRNEKSE